MTGILFLALQLALVPAVAPLVTGLVRRVKARALGRIGPSPLQPYRDLARLMRKQPVIAESASPLFLAAPPVAFILVWLASAAVPTFSTDLATAGGADLIVLVGLLAAARVATALAGLDVGTAFGGIGASRDMMIGALAEPAMLMVIVTVSLVGHSTGFGPLIAATQHGTIDVSLALALIALLMVGLAENGRGPIDNPATHLELTMVHEAMALEYSGWYLALVEMTQMVRLVLYLSLVGAIWVPWTVAGPDAPLLALPGAVAWAAKLAVGGTLLALFEATLAKMRVFRVGEFLGGALLLGLLATLFRLISALV